MLAKFHNCFCPLIYVGKIVRQIGRLLVIRTEPDSPYRRRCILQTSTHCRPRSMIWNRPSSAFVLSKLWSHPPSVLGLTSSKSLRRKAHLVLFPRQFYGVLDDEELSKAWHGFPSAPGTPLQELSALANIRLRASATPRRSLPNSLVARRPQITPANYRACFRGGISTVLPRSIASARAMRGRVACGMITSSI